MAYSQQVPQHVIKLALQWMKDEVSSIEAQRKLKVSSISQTVYKLGIALRQACREGLIPK